MAAGSKWLTHGVSLFFTPQHLQQHESGVEGESCYYHCVLCNYSTKAKLNLIQHVRSMKHQRSESLRKLQRLQKGLPEEDEDLGQIFTIRRCPSTDPGEWPRRHRRPRLGPDVDSMRPPEGFGLVQLTLESTADLTGGHCIPEGMCMDCCLFVRFFKGTWHHFSSGITIHCSGSQPPAVLFPPPNSSSLYSRFSILVQVDRKQRLHYVLRGIKNGPFVASSLACKK